MSCNCENCGGRITGLAHVGIFVKDIAVSKAFYTEKLGMEVTHTANNGIELAILQIGSMIIELVEKKDDPAREAGPIDHLAFAVEDIETLMCKLIEKGIKFNTDEVQTVPGIFGGIKNLWFDGPDGERLEFFEYL